MTLETLNLICIIWAAIGVASFILLQFVTAPYGRHVKKGWGPEISNKLGWIIMEAPSFFIILYFYLSSDQSLYASILSLLWLIHYLNRTFIYPFRIRTKGKKMPLIIVGSAIFFNCMNAGLNGYFLAHFESYGPDSFYQWNFILGIVLFIVGFIINQKSDHILIHLRKPGETNYKIPTGFLFKYVSCPNLFGELMQWSGFVIMAWNLPALSFLIWTAANLIPRALGHHKWYKKSFTEYPKNRKAMIPGIW
jgi:3-oxo-5-alpha-steroid 4-dehydrogenase 1